MATSPRILQIEGKRRKVPARAWRAVAHFGSSGRTRRQDTAEELWRAIRRLPFREDKGLADSVDNRERVFLPVWTATRGGDCEDLSMLGAELLRRHHPGTVVQSCWAPDAVRPRHTWFRYRDDGGRWIHWDTVVPVHGPTHPYPFQVRPWVS